MKQKTLFNSDVDQLDLMINEFESTHKVKASQSYYGDGTHFRVLFYEV